MAGRRAVDTMAYVLRMLCGRRRARALVMGASARDIVPLRKEAVAIEYSIMNQSRQNEARDIIFTWRARRPDFPSLRENSGSV